MKDKDLYQPSAEADFDARCRSLLEDRAVPAPEPRADLFAAASSGMGAARLRYGGAAVLLLAGAFLWSAWPTEEPSVPRALPELMDQEIPEAIGDGVIGPLVDPEGMDDMSLGSEANPVDEPVATRDAAPAELRNMEQSDISMGVDVVAPEVSKGGGAGVTAASPMATSSDEDAEIREKMSEEALQEEAVSEEAVSEPADAAPANTEPSNMEEASEGKPRLTLPLTLPSGGGQR